MLSKIALLQLLHEWLQLIRESQLRKEEAETKPFGTFYFLPKPGFPKYDLSERNLHEQDGNAAPGGKDRESAVRHFRMKFTPLESFQKRVNNYFAHFEPSLLNEGVDFGELITVTMGTEQGEDMP